MCRNIMTLFNFEPPATDEEIEASPLQFVRKAEWAYETFQGQRGRVSVYYRKT